VIEPVTEHQARLARQAYADFGTGSGHPARLNFGDCLSYALALDIREPLLWKGDDFGHTGIASALMGETPVPRAVAARQQTLTPSDRQVVRPCAVRRRPQRQRPIAAFRVSTQFRRGNLRD
jgi:hypothetical protein